MKVLKLTGVVALLVLSWGCSSDGDTGGEIPSDVAAVISANCQDCHGDPTANDAPMPITNCNDVLAAAPSNSSMTVAEAMQNRINSADNPMPPTGQLDSDPLATLDDWLESGTPGCE